MTEKTFKEYLTEESIDNSSLSNFIKTKRLLCDIEPINRLGSVIGFRVVSADTEKYISINTQKLILNFASTQGFKSIRNKSLNLTPSTETDRIDLYLPV
jgi:hypothetical protein